MSLLKSEPEVTDLQIGLPAHAEYQRLGLWDWNLAENLIYADETAAALFGVDAAQASTGLPPETYLCRIHPSDRSFIEKQIETCILSLGVCSDEYRVRGADGRYHWLYTRGRCFGDHTGRPNVYTGMAVKIVRPKAEMQDAAAAATTDPVGDILHICLNARALSAMQNLRIVTYLLDMLILELSKSGFYEPTYVN